jgi:DNA-binding CsgD family transcriptional regulator
VLRLSGSGETNQEIVARLVISSRTVQSHVVNILAKLDAPTRAEAVGIAAQEGLV